MRDNHSDYKYLMIRGEAFSDRYQADISSPSVDVIVPLLNTDVFFRNNLLSFYREVPINRLLIGNGGCSQECLDVLKDFPRVKIFDHQHLSSQGGSIVELIRAVETPKFIYFHSDVWLPNGFWDAAQTQINNYGWVESSRQIVTVNEKRDFSKDLAARSFSGVQIGDSSILKKAVKAIKDDYLQRNEDIIIRELVEESGGSYKKATDLIHLHQAPVQRSLGSPKYEDIRWATRIWSMHYKGIIKYLSPDMGCKSYLIDEVNIAFAELFKLGALDWEEVCSWIEKTNPLWLRHVRKPRKLAIVLKSFMQESRRRIKASIRILFFGYK